MKRANLIIEHIKNLPQFKLMNQYYCCKRFISLLNPRFQKAIAFSYVKDETLYIALSHPGFKMELYSKIEYLKSILTGIRDYDEECKNFKASRIVIFNSKLKSVIRKKREDSTIPYYEERAEGNFEVNIEDIDLKRIFERIRERINGAN
jgi:hypothetical protein